jgi:hypothetical protein
VATRPIAAATVSSLSGESLTGSSTSRTDFGLCPASGGYHGDTRYTATISTPTETYHDEGTSTVEVTITTVSTTLTENFTSSLTQAAPSGSTPALPSALTLPAW